MNLAFSLKDRNINLFIGSIVDAEFRSIHLNFFCALSARAPAAGPTNNFAERPPAQRSIKRAEFLNQFDQLNPAIFKEVMVSNDQARLAQEKIECKVF